MITILFASILILVVLIAEIYMHYKEYKEIKNKESMDDKKNDNIWDFDMKEENQSSANFGNETLYSQTESGMETGKKGKRGKNFRPKKTKETLKLEEDEFNFTY